MRSISHCLNKQLAELCQHAVHLEKLTSTVKKLLPEALAGACEVGSFTKGCLVLTTTHNEWASQLRYAIPELRDRLRKEERVYLSSIRIVLVEPTRSYEKPCQPKHSLSEEAKATIIRESQLCTYEPLQKALLNLANN